ncbi:hypothetical protein BJX61DRAFT_540960 [Aspergillus egyptiacus]|nr:hypothetical protein BJX61DRAFT_540960 [Aspergillus egyptiacus]
MSDLFLHGPFGYSSGDDSGQDGDKNFDYILKTDQPRGINQKRKRDEEDPTNSARPARILPLPIALYEGIYDPSRIETVFCMERHCRKFWYWICQRRRPGMQRRITLPLFDWDANVLPVLGNANMPHILPLITAVVKVSNMEREIELKPTRYLTGLNASEAADVMVVQRILAAADTNLNRVMQKFRAIKREVLQAIKILETRCRAAEMQLKQKGVH